MSGIDQVRQLLPWWVVWGPLLFTIPAIFVLSLVSAWLATAVAGWPLRRPDVADWVTRAQKGFPAVSVAGAALWMQSLCWLVFAILLLGPICPIPRPVFAWLAAASAFLGAAIVVRRTVARVRQKPLSWWKWWRGQVIIWVGFLGSVIALPVLLTILPRDLGWATWVILGLGSVVILFFGVGGGMFLLRAIGLLYPAGPRLLAIVERAAGRVGIRPPTVQEMDMVQVNAFALPFLRRIVFTGPAVEVLTDEELEAVCVHEMAHLSEPWSVLLLRLFPVVALVGLALSWVLVFALGWNGVLAACGVVVVILLWRLFFPYLFRWAERRADAAAQGHETETGVYARALLKLSEANVSPLVGPGKGTTHPHMYDRLVAAGVQPDFPRPAPPPRLPRFLGMVALTLPTILILIGVGIPARADRTEQGRLGIVAAQGGAHDAFLGIGVTRTRQGNLAEASVYFRAAAEVTPTSVVSQAYLAVALAQQGRCDEAEAAASEAARRSQKSRDPHDEILVERMWSAVRGCRFHRI